MYLFRHPPNCYCLYTVVRYILEKGKSKCYLLRSVQYYLTRKSLSSRYGRHL